MIRLGHPLAFALTAGQAHETTAFKAILQRVDADLTDCDGNAVAWPASLAGDKGYRANWIDEHLIHLGINPVIPSKTNEDREAPSVKFDPDKYRDRNIVERCNRAAKPGIMKLIINRRRRLIGSVRR